MELGDCFREIEEELQNSIVSEFEAIQSNILDGMKWRKEQGMLNRESCLKCSIRFSFK